ncbi:sensor histidine kinase [Methylobacterium sp. EM32]|uniref:sensor histidine kinase n=1 Tax=Methylobacterium sp. EM32 TaxID=3163481 RepID=UPI0033AC0AAB
MVCVSLDITDRKRLEERRAFLARELDRRVKDTLATVQSITHQTMRTSASMDEAQERIGARLKSLASAHDVLTREKWDGATIAEIVASALAPFTQSGAHRIRTGGPEVRLPPRSALALSMALHELATNAVKYGALSNDTGHVRFDWDIVGGAHGRLWLRWEEFNGPAIASSERQGFGSRLIQRTLATELAGKVEMDFRPTGLVFTAEAPLPDPLTSSDEPLRTD